MNDGEEIICHKCQIKKIDKWHLCKMSDLDSLKTKAIEDGRFYDAAKIRDWQQVMRR